MNMSVRHQYIERDSGVIGRNSCTETASSSLSTRGCGRMPPCCSDCLPAPTPPVLLGLINFDAPLAMGLAGNRRFLAECGVDLEECLQPPEFFDTPRKFFERQIRYWQCRPLHDDPLAVVSPADARVLIGSFREGSLLFLKEKFFDFDEFLGHDKQEWLRAFQGGDFAVFRLTPDKYHYNHVPVAGIVVDTYEIAGGYHSCNPGAVVEIVTPYSKNKRVVTIIDTDVPNGTGLGLVAMVEVVALMIGEIVQAYSSVRYDNPQAVVKGMFLEKGQPKSLYRPGSSTDVLIFQQAGSGLRKTSSATCTTPAWKADFPWASAGRLSERTSGSAPWWPLRRNILRSNNDQSIFRA